MPRPPRHAAGGIAALPVAARISLGAVIASVLPGAAKQCVPPPANFPSPKMTIELNTPQRERVASTINLFREGPDMRVRPGAWGIITERLSSFGASLANYKKIGATWLRQFMSGVDPAHISLSRGRKGKCGPLFECFLTRMEVTLCRSPGRFSTRAACRRSCS